MALYFRWLRILKYYLNIKVLLGLVPLVLIINTLLYVLLFSKSNVVVIPLEDIANQLVTFDGNANNSTNIKYCEIASKDISNILYIPKQPVPDEVLELLQTFNIDPGGAWKPSGCISQHKVAIIVPYRDRLQNLRDFLAYMHPFLQKQMLNYRIVVVEQSEGRPFNRAKLFNVGFKETERIEPFHCYIFHDVDLIPQNLNNIYSCTKLVRHMSANIDVFNYKVPYDSIIGGAVAILKTQFLHINGFSNTFFGWGGEDDDFYNRVTKNGTKICRFSSNISQYVMLSHKKEKPSADRYYVLDTGKDRFLTDGLNSLKYSVLKIEMLPLYTRIFVDL